MELKIVRTELSKSGRCDFLLHRISTDKIIINKWAIGKYDYEDNNLKVFVDELFSIPDGIYELRALKFYDSRIKLISALTNPFDFSSPYFHSTNNVLWDIGIDGAADIMNEWEKEVSIGSPNESSDIKFREVHFICKDALLTTPVRIGHAELYPLSRHGLIDIANSIKEMLLLVGIKNVELAETIKFLNSEPDKRPPLFTLSFSRIYEAKENIMETLLPYIQTIFGILAINRGGYPTLLSAVYIEYRKNNTFLISPFNLNSYYRGNLNGGGIVGESPNLFNKQYEKIINSEFLIEMVNKLNLAHSVLDLDLAYFQYWSILEAISFYLFKDPKINTVVKLINLVYNQDELESNITLTIGKETFNSDQLFKMWKNRRDLTAHNGGISSSFEGLKKIHGDNSRFIQEMERTNTPLMYGEDNCLYLLKDVCTKVVRKFINEEIIDS